MALQPILEHARSLYGSARAAKRAEQQHRREAQRYMAELRAWCAGHGIEVEDVKTAMKGGTESDGKAVRQGWNATTTRQGPAEAGS